MLQIITAASAWMKTKHKREADKSREIIGVHNLISTAASSGSSFVIVDIANAETLVQLHEAGYDVSLVSEDGDSYLISWGDPAEMTVETYRTSLADETGNVSRETSGKEIENAKS